MIEEYQLKLEKWFKRKLTEEEVAILQWGYAFGIVDGTKVKEEGR